MPISRIEVEFAMPVELTGEETRIICEIVNQAARRTETADIVHWQSGSGSKPLFSQADQLFLGKEVDPSAPEIGEPTWDDTVLYIETCARQRYESEIWEPRP